MISEQVLLDAVNNRKQIIFKTMPEYRHCIDVLGKYSYLWRNGEHIGSPSFLIQSSMEDRTSSFNEAYIRYTEDNLFVLGIIDEQLIEETGYVYYSNVAKKRFKYAK